MLVVLLIVFIIYLATKYSDMLSAEKAKELTLMAMKRSIKEFFGQV